MNNFIDVQNFHRKVWSYEEQNDAPPFAAIVLSIQVLCLATSAYTPYNPSWEGVWKKVMCTVQSRTTYSSTTRPPADNPDQVVLVCQGVLHSERSSAIPTTGALACGPGTNHVARDLVFERPIRYSDTSPWGGLVVGRGRVAEVVQGARGAPAEKFGLGRKFWART